MKRTLYAALIFFIALCATLTLDAQTKVIGVPAGGTMPPVINSGLTGTFTLDASSGASVYIWTLANSGSVTMSSVANDTVGHVTTFEISQLANTYVPFFWPPNFINPPQMPQMAGAKIVGSFVFDGTNYLPVNVNYFQNGPVESTPMNYVRNSNNLAASTWTVTGSPTITTGLADGLGGNNASKIVTTGVTTFADSTAPVQLNSTSFLSCVHAKGNAGGETLQVAPYNLAATGTSPVYTLSTGWVWYCNIGSRGNNYNHVFDLNIPNTNPETIFVDATMTTPYAFIYQGQVLPYSGYIPSYIATKGVQITSPVTQFLSMWPASAGFNGTAGAAFVANQTVYFGYTLNTAVTVNAIGWRTTTVDNTANLYDIGLYTPSGALIFHTGALAGSTLFASLNYKDQAVVGGPYPIPPGNYVIAITTNCASACATISGWTGSGSMLLPYAGAAGGATSGGALNATITAPTKTWAAQTTNWWIALHD